MNAIRRDEELDALHSAYVDQWDWEKIITREDRNVAYLQQTVKSIVQALADTQYFLHSVFPQLSVLPRMTTDITFVSTQELEDLYSDKTPKERENAFVKDHPVTFLMGIGGKLHSGKPHDGRAPDYDDWDHERRPPGLGPRELARPVRAQSSMGIRVGPVRALDRQLTLAGCDNRRQLPFHKHAAGRRAAL